MNLNTSNLYSLSKNKYNINLLETIEHKELFKNLNKNLNKNKLVKNELDKYNNNSNNKNNENSKDVNNEYYIINDDNSFSDEKNGKNNSKNNIIYYEPKQKMIKNSKMSSKSFKNIIKNKDKFCKYQDLFARLSPEKSQRCITQDNESHNKEINNFNNIKTKNELKYFPS